MQITSKAFAEGEAIPRSYTCDGDDASPPLAISDVPQTAVSLALVMDDPDAPAGTWVHWILFDLPAGTRELPVGVPSVPRPPVGGAHGKNTWGRSDYGGPCPPSGTHRYFFRLYALDTTLGLEPGASREEVDRAMAGHVAASAVLMGRYHR